MSLMDGLICYAPLGGGGEPLGTHRYVRENGTITDDVSGDFPGKLTGNGVTHYFEITGATDVISTMTPITVAGWIKRETGTGYAVVGSTLPFLDSIPGGWRLGFTSGSNSVSMRVRTAAGTPQVVKTWPNSQWIFLTGVYDPINLYVALWMNGIHQGNAALDSPSQATFTNIRFGYFGGAANTQYVSRCSLWNRVLNDREILELFELGGIPSDNIPTGAGGVPVPFARFDGNPFAGVS